MTIVNYIVIIDDIMPRPQTTTLTAAHKRLLRVITNYYLQNRPISVSEVARKLGMAGETSVLPTLRIMERNGYVRFDGGGKHGQRRIVLLSDKGKFACGVGAIPVLGNIQAGPISEVVENSDIFISDVTGLGAKPGDFFLVVTGQSLIGDAIAPGDLVLMRPNVVPNNGEIAAVHIGDEYFATLKHIVFSADTEQVTLRASNPDFEDIILSRQDIRISGVYRGLIRKV